MTTKTPAAEIRSAVKFAIDRCLTDDDWAEHFERAARHPIPTPHDSSPLCESRALLAYLDEVWAGLTIEGRSALGRADRVFHSLGAYMAGSTRDALVRRHLVRARPYTPKTTPLGRAVLKRAKEQG